MLLRALSLAPKAVVFYKKLMGKWVFVLSFLNYAQGESLILWQKGMTEAHV